MLTMKGWRESSASNFDDYALPCCKVGECIYWHFLEILPPIYVNRGFMVSEPYSYCSVHNTNTYACFVQVYGDYYYLGNISPKAVKLETEKLIKLIGSEA